MSDTSDGGSFAAWVAAQQAKKAPTQELRIALAMRGGVSLAVWIGGAVAELDLLRRGVLAAEAARAGVHADEIRQQFFEDLKPGPEWQRAQMYGETVGEKYTSIRIDVLAGASAGGLNSVLYGMAQTLGVGVEWMRSTWVARGDLWSLMRPGWRPGEPFRVASLLQGDAKFYPAVLAEARQNSTESRERLISRHVSVNLAATLESAPPRLQRSEEMVRPPEVHFHFRKLPRTGGGDSGDDMPRDRDDDLAMARLAYAARTTSSFPGAFEPAQLLSFPDDPSPLKGELPDDADVPARINFVGTFSETTEVMVDGIRPLMSVFDGGVFDNIPISRALDAISEMPADRGVERHLFYLDPDPPDTAQPPDSGKARRGDDLSTFFLATALRALRMKQRVETAEDDVATIRRVTSEAQEFERLRKMAFARAGAALDSTPNEDLWSRYAKWRAGNDAERITTACVAPGLSTLRSLGAPAVTDATLAQASAIGLQGRLLSQLRSRHRYGPSGDKPADAKASPNSWLPACADDARSLFLACGFLVTVTDFDERTAPEMKLQAYARRQRVQLIRAAASRFADAADLAAVREGQRQGFWPPETMAESMATAYATAAQGGPSEPAEVGTGPVPTFVDRLAWPEQVDTEAPGAGNPWAVDEREFWDRLMRLPADARFADYRADLWRLTAANAQFADPTVLGVDLTPISEEGADPRPLQRFTAYLASQIGEPVVQSLRYYRPITASARAAAGQTFPQVCEARERNVVETLVGLPPRGLTQARVTWQLERPVLVAQSKLAGNQLGNFAGFLDGDWRNHDFAWGRRDAAATILDHLLKQPTGDGRTPVTASEGKPKPITLPWRARPVLDRPRITMGDLSASRRFGLASRAAQLLQRAVWPLTWSGQADTSFWKDISARNVSLAMLLLALRLPLTVLPLLFATWRLVLVLVLSVLSVRFFPATPSALAGLPRIDERLLLPNAQAGALAWVLGAALLVALAARVLSVRRTWRRLGGLLPADRPQMGTWTTVGSQLSTIALIALVPMVVVGVLLVTDVKKLNGALDGWRISTWFERGLALTLLALAVWLIPITLKKVSASVSIGPVLRVIWVPLMAVGLMALLSLARDPSMGPVLDDISTRWVPLLVSAAIAAAVSGLVTYGWVRGEWVFAAVVATAGAVVLADLLVAAMAGDSSFKRYWVVPLVAALFVQLVIVAQWLGNLAGDNAIRAVVTLATFALGALATAVIGQLLFASVASLGIPFGLWQGVFIAALVTVFVQPADDPY